MRFEIEFNSHTNESGQKKCSYLFYGKILRFISLHYPECVYIIYTNIQIYRCVTHSNILRSCCALLFQSKILGNFHIVFIFYFYFLFALTSANLRTSLSVDNRDVRSWWNCSWSAAISISCFSYVPKNQQIFTQSSRDEAALKKSRTMGNAMPGCQNALKKYYFYYDPVI